MLQLILWLKELIYGTLWLLISLQSVTITIPSATASIPKLKLGHALVLLNPQETLSNHRWMLIISGSEFIPLHCLTCTLFYLPSSCAWRLWWRWRPPPTAIPPSATPTATSTEDTDTEDTAAASEDTALDMASAAADTEVDTADMEDTTPDMDMVDIAVD